MVYNFESVSSFGQVLVETCERFFSPLAELAATQSTVFHWEQEKTPITQDMHVHM